MAATTWRAEPDCLCWAALGGVVHQLRRELGAGPVGVLDRSHRFDLAAEADSATVQTWPLRGVALEPLCG